MKKPVQFTTRNRYEVKKCPHDEVEILAGARAFRYRPVALEILSEFRTPTDLQTAHQTLTRKSRSKHHWLELTQTLHHMLKVGLLVSEGTEAEAHPSVDKSSVRRHVELLNDPARTKSLIAAIKATVKPGDRVLDIGCGTGVLALAAAQAGAERVYAIEKDPATADYARRMIRENGFEKTIRVIEALSTQTELPERCDVLVSEIIGDEPLSENILPVFLDATQRHLKPNARVIPHDLTVFGWPVTLPREYRARRLFTPERLNDWEQNYGMRFSSLLEANRRIECEVNIRPQDWTGLRFIGSPLPLAEFKFPLERYPRFDHRVDFPLENDASDGFVVFFHSNLGFGHSLSNHPVEAPAHNSWHAPLYFFRNAVHGTLSVGYAQGIPGRSNGFHLINSN